MALPTSSDRARLATGRYRSDRRQETGAYAIVNDLSTTRLTVDDQGRLLDGDEAYVETRPWTFEHVDGTLAPMALVVRDGKVDGVVGDGVAGYSRVSFWDSGALWGALALVGVGGTLLAGLGWLPAGVVRLVRRGRVRWEGRAGWWRRAVQAGLCALPVCAALVLASLPAAPESLRADLRIISGAMAVAWLVPLGAVAAWVHLWQHSQLGRSWWSRTAVFTTAVVLTIASLCLVRWNLLRFWDPFLRTPWL